MCSAYDGSRALGAALLGSVGTVVAARTARASPDHDRLGRRLVLAEHESPGEATLYVLSGRVRLGASQAYWDGLPGDLLIIKRQQQQQQTSSAAARLSGVAATRSFGQVNGAADELNWIGFAPGYRFWATVPDSGKWLSRARTGEVRQRERDVVGNR